ncbi:hypothetical protein KJ937_03835 [Patescibacteria group bacterium]|nr:hypothetical protein [Patescibacteria group bacterium]
MKIYQFIKENKVKTALVFLIFLIGFVYLLSNYSCKAIATLENFDLPLFGEYDNQTAKYLVLFPLRAIIDPNIKINDDDQKLGYGLLGASLLDTGDEFPMLGYRSFFLGGSDIVGLYGVTSKLESSFLIQENIFLIGPDLSITPTNSIIRKREAAIYAIAFGIDDRYTYKYTHELVNDAGHIVSSNNLLKNVLTEADQVFEDLKNRGYEDLTLKYALGILYASLKNDGVKIRNINESKFGTPQIYVDALRATLSSYRYETRLEEKTFLNTLTGELGDRKINMLDLAFFKKNSSSDNVNVIDDTPALIKIIEDDLNQIAK